MMSTETFEVIKELPFGVPVRAGEWVLCRRVLTLKEKRDRVIQLASVCVCGSGKRFKECCYTGKR